MIVLNSPRELADLLPVDLEVVRVPVVGSDDVVGDAHAGRFSPCSVSGASLPATLQLPCFVAVRTPPLSRLADAKQSLPAPRLPRQAPAPTAPRSGPPS